MGDLEQEIAELRRKLAAAEARKKRLDDEAWLEHLRQRQEAIKASDKLSKAIRLLGESNG
jgi:CRISPR/Cas system-associated protein Csm6